MNTLTNWCQTKYVVFNVDNCLCIVFSRRKSPMRFRYAIEKNSLQRINKLKKMGVLFRNQLTFHSHTNAVSLNS